MKRPVFLTLQLALFATALGQVPVATGLSCKPCGEPTFADLLRKADVVAVAQVLKVEVSPKGPEARSTAPGPQREVRWQVQVVRGLKGRVPRTLTVQGDDAPPCITALVPQPGRYVILLYQRDGNYSPLSYCDQPLFAIDEQDRVALTPAMATELHAAGKPVTLELVVNWVARTLGPAPPP